jgi:hypothetical protein
MFTLSSHLTHYIWFSDHSNQPYCSMCAPLNYNVHAQFTPHSPHMVHSNQPYGSMRAPFNHKVLCTLNTLLTTMVSVGSTSHMVLCAHLSTIMFSAHCTLYSLIWFSVHYSQPYGSIHVPFNSNVHAQFTPHSPHMVLRSLQPTIWFYACSSQLRILFFAHCTLHTPLWFSVCYTKPYQPYGSVHPQLNHMVQCTLNSIIWFSAPSTQPYGSVHPQLNHMVLCTRSTQPYGSVHPQLNHKVLCTLSTQPYCSFDP